MMTLPKSSKALMDQALRDSEVIIRCACGAHVSIHDYEFGGWCDPYEPEGCPDCMESLAPQLAVLIEERDIWVARIAKRHQ